MLDKNRIKLGIAPIGWTNDDLPDLGAENTFEQCISEMALAGFEGCEVGNKYPKDPAVLKKALDLRGITVCNAWFSAMFTSKPYDEVISDFIEHRDFLHAVGAQVIGVAEVGNSVQGQSVSVFRNKPVFTEEQWEVVIKGCNEMAALAEEKGMKMTYHHHMGTGIQTKEEIERFMDSSNENVCLLFDTGHCFYSEGNQEAGIEILKKYVKRVGHVHLKDVRPEVLEKVRKENLSFLEGVREGTFTVPGDGAINFDPIFEILEANDYEGWLVVEAEQDPAKANPFEYALKARKFIKEKTGL